MKRLLWPVVIILLFAGIVCVMYVGEWAEQGGQVQEYHP